MRCSIKVGTLGLLLITLMSVLVLSAEAPRLEVYAKGVYRYEGHLTPGSHTLYNLTHLIEERPCLTVLSLGFLTYPEGQAEVTGFYDYRNVVNYTTQKGPYGYVLQLKGSSMLDVEEIVMSDKLYLTVKNIGEEEFDYTLFISKWIICAVKYP